MPSITLKEIPEELHQKLKEEAAANGRSLNKEILVRLRVSLSAEGADSQKIAERARHVRELFGGALAKRDLDRYKRQGRT